MKTLTREMTLAMLVAASITGHAQEAQGNRLYDDYIARRDAYHAKAAEVKQEFLSIRNFEWKLIIDKRMSSMMERILFNKSFLDYDGKSHVEVYGEAKAFADKYTAGELASGLWGLLEAPRQTRGEESRLAQRPDKLWTNLVALAFAKGGMETGPAPAFPQWPYSAYEAAAVIGSETHPLRFSGFILEQVGSDITANPSLRAEYIGAIVKILADPDIRRENPPETKNLLGILGFVLKAEEAMRTFVDYMLWDVETGEDYRLQEGDWIRLADTDKMSRHNIFRITQLPLYQRLIRFGNKSIPDVLWRFANASEIERKVGTGGGGTPIFATLYFTNIRVSQPDALRHVEDFKQEHFAKLTDTQKETLDEIITTIKEKRFCTDGSLNNPDEAIRTWAPSYGKEAAPAP